MSDLKLTPQILAMYLGCEVQAKKKDDNVNGWHTGRICEVTRRSNHGDWIKVWFEDVKTVYQYNSGRGELKSNAHYYFIVEDEIKPILRRLSSMTEEAARELFDSFARYGEETVISRKHGNTIEVICYDPKDYEEDGVPDNPVPDQLFEDAEMNEALMRVELKPFNVYKGWEHDYNEVYDNMTNYHIFRWLLSKHFDLFGLIDAGLAIEKP